MTDYKCGRCAGHATIQGVKWDHSNPHEIRPIAFKQQCPDCVDGIPHYTIQAFRDGTNRNPVDLTDYQIAWGLIAALAGSEH